MSKLALWEPTPIDRPRIERHLSMLPPIQRAAEVLRYSLLRAEHWLSPNGSLRAWIRLNILAALCLGIPAIILVPLFTYVLGQFATWTLFLAQAAKNLVLFIGYVLAGVVLLSGALMFIRSRLRNHERKRR